MDRFQQAQSELLCLGDVAAWWESASTLARLGLLCQLGDAHSSEGFAWIVNPYDEEVTQHQASLDYSDLCIMIAKQRGLID